MQDVTDNPEPTTESVSVRAQYMADFRKREPETAEANALASKARSRALQRVAREYPELLEELMNEEREKLGLPRRGVVGRGRGHRLVDHISVPRVISTPQALTGSEA